jgi:hypothetical protein
MAAESDPEQIAAAERHNRLAKQIVSEIVYAPICDGGTMSDVMMLCESVLVGVLLECFKLGDGEDARSDRGARQGTAREGSTGGP